VSCLACLHHVATAGPVPLSIRAEEGHADGVGPPASRAHRGASCAASTASLWLSLSRFAFSACGGAGQTGPHHSSNPITADSGTATETVAPIDKPADPLNTVEVEDGVATADHATVLRTPIPGPVSSCGSSRLLAMHDTTLLQFPEIVDTRCSLSGRCRLQRVAAA
jgi:hypothetical protein